MTGNCPACLSHRKKHKKTSRFIQGVQNVFFKKGSGTFFSKQTGKKEQPKETDGKQSLVLRWLGRAAKAEQSNAIGQPVSWG